MATLSGFITGLMGYSLKKEMLSDAFFFRETQTFKYEIYSVDITGLRPYIIQQNIYNEFRDRYSGDINVKVFNQPVDYSFPNDSIRSARFEVEVQVKSVPAIGTWQPELTGNYYSGIHTGFWQNSGIPILDFKEGFDFETNDNGSQTFSHNVSFGLLTGSKQYAINLVSGIFAKDKDTTFGISTMVGGITTIADSSLYQNYYTESYDTLRDVYSFSRKREILPSGTSTYIYNLTHSLETKDDGTLEVNEKGNVKGKLTFAQAQLGAEELMGSSYNRCNAFYSGYAILTNPFSTAVTGTLVSSPFKIARMVNRPAITNDYEIAYTNNPQFKSNGTTIEETMDIDDSEIGVIGVKHTINFTLNKRSSTSSFDTLIQNAISSSPTIVSTYFTAYNPTARALSNIKKDISWPNKKSKGAKVMMEYNNHPKYFVVINGTTYNLIDCKVAHTQPVDMITEYKVINRPTKFSVMNYAYQTERGQITITIDAGLGRDSNEFITGFRSDIGTALFNLYQHAISLFFQEFHNTIPLAFTYYLSDVKYNYNSESGVLQLVTIFTYSLKKGTPPSPPATPVI